MVIFLTLTLFSVSCDNSFEPLAENDDYFFSMYGYLDASADTQWVRVTPARDQLEMAPVTPDMRVTLEDLESGRTVVMNDSLMQTRRGLNILNFWTTADIERNRSYRLKAERPDGASSSATVTTPVGVPDLSLVYLGDNCRAILDVMSKELLADVQTVWHVRIQSGDLVRKRKIRFAHRSETFGRGTVNYRLNLNISQEKGRIILPAGDSTVTGVDVFAASGGPEWIEDIASIDDLEYALPEGLSNVENGVGYVIGIASTTIPYEGCGRIIEGN